MSPLADLQRRMARALLQDPDALPAELFAAGPIPAAEALRVHRGTAIGGLVNALRLAFPTVLALTGEDFFDQAAAAFARRRPPGEANLAAYGDGFADFLEGYTPARGHPYLGDVAALDLAVERCGSAADLTRLHRLDDAISLGLPVSLVLLAVRRPADQIRAALAEGDEDALAGIDLKPARRSLAVWRRKDEVGVRPLSDPAALFLAGLTEGRSADEALSVAAQAGGAEAALLAIQSDVFAAPFAVITPNPPELAVP